MLLCCVLCKRNWKNQVWLGALWGRKLLRGTEKGEKGKIPHRVTPQLRMLWQEHIACTEPMAVVTVAVVIHPPSTCPLLSGEHAEAGIWTAAQPKVILPSAYSPRLFSSHHPTSPQPPEGGSVSTVLKGKTALNSSLILFSLWPVVVFLKKMINL